MVAACDAARDTRFIRRLHASLGLPIPNPTPLMIDSSSALQWANKKAKWSASRHMATRYFCIQQWRRDGVLLPLKVDTTRQIADICTKALPHATFVNLRATLMGSHRDDTPIISLNDTDTHFRIAPPGV